MLFLFFHLIVQASFKELQDWKASLSKNINLNSFKKRGKTQNKIIIR